MCVCVCECECECVCVGVIGCNIRGFIFTGGGGGLTYLFFLLSLHLVNKIFQSRIIIRHSSL